MASAYELTATRPSDEWITKAKKIAAEVASPHAEAVDRNGTFPKETISAMAESGFFGLNLPKAIGGGGALPRTFAAVTEELATVCASSAMVYVMHTAASQAIAASSTFTAKEETLKSIAQGKHLSTLAFSETGSRSQFWLPISQLTKSGNDFSVSAKKSWVTSANHADSYIAAAKATSSQSSLESTLYFVKKGSSGVHVEGTFNGLGLRGNESAPVTFKEVAISKGNLICPEGKGLEGMLQVVLPWFAIGSAAMAHGICRAAISATSQHLSGTGFDGGSKLRDLSNLRVRLAQMNMRTERSRALLGWTLSEMEAPNEMTPLYVLQSRLSALETVVEVTDLAMKTCGGAAFSKHLGIERLFRDARAGWVMAPTVDHLEDFVGKALTGLPLF